LAPDFAVLSTAGDLKNMGLFPQWAEGELTLQDTLYLIVTMFSSHIFLKQIKVDSWLPAHVFAG